MTQIKIRQTQLNSPLPFSGYTGLAIDIAAGPDLIELINKDDRVATYWIPYVSLRIRRRIPTEFESRAIFVLPANEDEERDPQYPVAFVRFCRFSTVHERERKRTLGEDYLLSMPIHYRIVTRESIASWMDLLKGVTIKPFDTDDMVLAQSQTDSLQDTVRGIRIDWDDYPGASVYDWPDTFDNGQNSMTVLWNTIWTQMGELPKINLDQLNGFFQEVYFPSVSANDVQLHYE